MYKVVRYKFVYFSGSSNVFGLTFKKYLKAKTVKNDQTIPT